MSNNGQVAPVYQSIPIVYIVPNPEQPRQVFDENKLTDLGTSIIARGLIQPITVEATPHNDLYILEDGERRLRACRMVGLTMIDAIVKPGRTGPDVSHDRLLNALVANLQREDMNPIDEALAIDLVFQRLGSVTKVCRQIGRSAPYVNLRLLMLSLDPEIQDMIAQGRLQKDKRVIAALLSIPDSDARIKLARSCSSQGMTISLILAKTKGVLYRLQTRSSDTIDAPAAHHAQKRTGAVNAELWRRLVADGLVPSWEVVQAASVKACQKCAFYDSPSEAICGECPAVDLVQAIIREANKR